MIQNNDNNSNIFILDNCQKNVCHSFFYLKNLQITLLKKMDLKNIIVKDKNDNTVERLNYVFYNFLRDPNIFVRSIYPRRYTVKINIMYYYILL